MADIQKIANFTVDSASRYILGDAWDGEPGGIAIQLPSVSGSIAVTVQGRCRTNTSGGWVPIPYRQTYLNGAVGTGALASGVITGASLIYVEAPGYDVALSVVQSGAIAVPVCFQKVRGGGGLG